MTTLNILKPNDCAKVVDIAGGRRIKKRLYELGHHKGTSFKVLKNDFGPVIVCLTGNRLALGRGLASSVSVQKQSN